MPTAVRSPRWTSYRRLLEQALADLHRCSDPRRVRQAHAQVFKLGLHGDLLVAPKLVAAYSLCRQVSAAANAFGLVPVPNAHLYNTLIRAHADNSLPCLAFAAFFDMQSAGVSPDNFTFPSLLRACSSSSSSASTAAPAQIGTIHAQIIKMGFLGDIFVPNSLLDSYCRSCSDGGIASAYKLFDAMSYRDIVSWNTMVAGLARAGELGEARKLFDVMPDRDMVSWNAILAGYARAAEMQVAFELFKRMPERNVVSWSTMISGYCRASGMEMARLLFDKMPVKNLVTWTIMISGYAEKGLAKEAKELFEQMEADGLKADAAAAVSILSACAESGLLGLGQKVHAHLLGTKVECTTHVCNSLLDMYAKCGDLVRAWEVFDGTAKRDRVSWNSMIQGLAAHGHGEEALALFAEMEDAEDGVPPDGVTFLGVLTACTHAGRVAEGRRHFAAMEHRGVAPQVEHYGCMVDLLSRNGRLEEASQLVEAMPFGPNAVVLGTLLSACRLHGNVGLAERVADQMARLEPRLDPGNSALLSNIYAAAGRWDSMAEARARMKGAGAQKKPAGFSSIEVDGLVHVFTVGDRSHPRRESILEMLDEVGRHIRLLGHAVPKPCLCNI